MVELPITLTQDHTLFVILRRDHPDYMLDDGLYTPVYIAERPGAPQCF